MKTKNIFSVLSFLAFDLLFAYIMHNQMKMGFIVWVFTFIATLIGGIIFVLGDKKVYEIGTLLFIQLVTSIVAGCLSVVTYHAPGLALFPIVSCFCLNITIGHMLGFVVKNLPDIAVDLFKDLFKIKKEQKI